MSSTKKYLLILSLEKNGIDAALMKKNYSIKREWFWNVSIQSLPLSVVSNAPVTVNTPYTEGNSKPIISTLYNTLTRWAQRAPGLYLSPLSSQSVCTEGPG